jgi:hypothetical protein
MVGSQEPPPLVCAEMSTGSLFKQARFRGPAIQNSRIKGGCPKDLGIDLTLNQTAIFLLPFSSFSTSQHTEFHSENGIPWRGGGLTLEE